MPDDFTVIQDALWKNEVPFLRKHNTAALDALARLRGRVEAMEGLSLGDWEELLRSVCLAHNEYCLPRDNCGCDALAERVDAVRSIRYKHR